MVVLADFARELTVTEGTGTLTMQGPVEGYRSFASVVDSGDVSYFSMSDGRDLMVFEGTVNVVSGVTTVTINEVLASSQNGAKVFWAAGEKEVWMTVPAVKLVVADERDRVQLKGKRLVFEDAGKKTMWWATDVGVFQIADISDEENWRKVFEWQPDHVNPSPEPLGRVRIFGRAYIEVIETDVLRINGQQLGSAASRDVGVTSGDVPELDVQGKLARSTLPPIVPAQGNTPGQAGAVPAPGTGTDQTYSLSPVGWRRRIAYYTSAWQAAGTWAAGQSYGFVHGLSAAPQDIWLEVECVSAEHDYLAGETIIFRTIQTETGGLQIDHYDKEAYVRIMGSGIQVWNGSGVMVTVSPSRWRFRLHCSRREF